MPYVSSKKTDGKSTDREVIDAALEPLAQKVAEEITNNFSLRKIYERTFIQVASDLRDMLKSTRIVGNGLTWDLARAIYETSAKYGYEGAYLGEFNYAFTRFIQRVPQIKVARGDWKDELRYWLYAETVTALKHAEDSTKDLDIGVDGVFLDIKDEYKRRMNTAYEAAQIVKSGDCYDGPYYTRLVEIVDERGKIIGHMEVMLKRSEETLHQDVLDHQLVLSPKKKQ